MKYFSWFDAVFDFAIDPLEAFSRWLDGEDAEDWDGKTWWD